MKGKTLKVSQLIWIIVIIIAIAFGIYLITHRAKKMPAHIESAKVQKGTIVNSVSADGVIEPVTNVEIKSNVGGTIIKLYADEGDYVKAGQLLAQIDPTDVKTTLEKEQNNVISSKSKLNSAEESLVIQRQQALSDLNSAKENVKSCELKLANAKKEAKAQPTITSNEIATAKANLEQAKSTLAQMKKATNSQKIASAKSSYDSALASYNANKNTYERNKSLLEKGYVSKTDYESSEQQYLASKANYESAKEKYDTIKDEIASDLKVQEEKVKSCEIALKNAKTNSFNIDVKNNEVSSAESALRAAKSSLASAQANLRNITVKENAVTQARADLASANSSLENAQKNFNYTNITAPRDGVIVKKWTEEGSIIMGGRSSTAGSSEGVVIFELADTTKMQVSVDVDETDISSISMNQMVKISVDAFADTEYTGKVTRICPSAETESGVTTVPVEVTFDGVHQELKPEMNATCEFIVATKNDILTVPVDYVDVTGDTGSTYIMDANNKPQQVQFKVGLVGEESVEVLDTLKEGQTIISPRFADILSGKSKDKSSDKKNKMGGPPPM